MRIFLVAGFPNSDHVLDSFILSKTVQKFWLLCGKNQTKKEILWIIFFPLILGTKCRFLYANVKSENIGVIRVGHEKDNNLLSLQTKTISYLKRILLIDRK